MSIDTAAKERPSTIRPSRRSVPRTITKSVSHVFAVNRLRKAKPKPYRVHKKRRVVGHAAQVSRLYGHLGATEEWVTSQVAARSGAWRLRGIVVEQFAIWGNS